MLKHIRKICSVILCICILVLSTAGCSGKNRTLTVLVDMEYQVLETFYTIEKAIADFEGVVERAGIENVVFEFMPKEGVERETAIDRIRTEIMSGKGPDVFLIACDGSRLYGNYTDMALFQIPEKAMESGLFLPLDEYIETAEHAEWDRFLPQIMEAGRTDEGQVFIPLSYTTRAALYRKSEFEHTPSKDMTWQQMLEDETLHDTAAVLSDGGELIDSGRKVYTTQFHPDFTLGDLADYKNEELLFTEEELHRRVEECLELYDYSLNEKLYEETGRSERYLGLKFNGLIFEDDLANGLTREDTFTMVPLYSDDGGVTAQIMAYAAINRNTRRPEDAFTVIDLLLKTNYQQASIIFNFWILSDDGGASIHEGLMSKDYPMWTPGSRQVPGMDWYMSDENFAAFCNVRESITNVQYLGALNSILHEMMMDCYIAKSLGNDYTDIVSKAYNTMRLMVSE